VVVRRKCFPAAKRGGLLYLDNADADKDLSHYTNPTQGKEAQKYLGSSWRKGAKESS
jgi:hypothetical protein